MKMSNVIYAYKKIDEDKIPNTQVKSHIKDNQKAPKQVSKISTIKKTQSTNQDIPRIFV